MNTGKNATWGSIRVMFSNAVREGRKAEWFGMIPETFYRRSRINLWSEKTHARAASFCNSIRGARRVITSRWHAVCLGKTKEKVSFVPTRRIYIMTRPESSLSGNVCSAWTHNGDHGSAGYPGVVDAPAVLSIYESRGELQPAGDARYPLSRLQFDGGNDWNIKRIIGSSDPKTIRSRSTIVVHWSSSGGQHAKSAALYLVPDTCIYKLAISWYTAPNLFHALTGTFLFFELYLNPVTFSMNISDKHLVHILYTWLRVRFKRKKKAEHF